MAIVKALLTLNDLGRSVTPIFLFRNGFYKALTINVKAQLMERDAIYVQSLLHL